VTVTETSADAVALTVVDAELFDVAGSVVDAVTEAVAVSGRPATSLGDRLPSKRKTSGEDVGASGPLTVQVIVGRLPLQVQPAGLLMDGDPNEEGSDSVSVTPAALLGPRFSRVTV
jgi:hypothetical protein